MTKDFRPCFRNDRRCQCFFIRDSGWTFVQVCHFCATENLKYLESLTDWVYYD